MLALVSAGAAETANGAVERMRMVLFSFTNAYYTKKLPRKVPRNLPRTAFQTPENWSDRNSGVWNLKPPRNLPRSKLEGRLLCAAVWGCRCLAGLGAEPDLAARRFRGRQLLHEVAHTALDLLDVTFNCVNTASQSRNLPDFLNTIKKHLTKNPCRPSTKTYSLWRLYPVTDRNHDIKIVHQFRTATTSLNIVQILHINPSVQFAFPYRIVNMPNKNSSITAKQFHHLVDCHPYGLSICLDR